MKFARDLGGKFDADKKFWLFPVSRADAVREAAQRVYGVRPAREGEARVTVRLTARREISVRCAPIMYKGILIAEARGRDSGAKIGPDCALLSGVVTSGGSRDNWRTEVRPGAVIEITGIPLSHAAGDDEWSVEIVGAAAVTVDRDALIAERAALLARLTEIDAALSSEAITAE